VKVIVVKLPQPQGRQKLPQPQGRQKEVLYLPAEGHTVVLGTAGSGKTTLAMLRAAMLANPTLSHGGKVLLLAFNNALLRYFESFEDLRNANVDIRTYHHFARGYLQARGKMSYSAICDPRNQEELVEAAVQKEQADHPTEAILRRPTRFLIDEINWLMQHGVTKLKIYEAARRTGRAGARLAPVERKHVFALYKTYLSLRAAKGKMYDWDDLATAVITELAVDKSARMYRHVVIDEGQDFSLTMLQSLAALIPPDGTLTFFGDMAQQIYGHKLSWRDAGLHPKKVWEFQENYRNTQQIAALALAIARMPYFIGTPDLVQPNNPSAAGPPPALVACSTAKGEFEFVGKTANTLSGSGSVAVLMATRDEETALKRLLPRDSIQLHKDMSAWKHEPRVYYGTFAAAKGLEFDSVIVPRLSANRFPDPKEIEAYGIDGASALAGKQLYVATTRARANLVMTYVEKPSSLLPSGNLYTRSST
jgi:superfamily I DNA/RNA helicase